MNHFPGYRFEVLHLPNIYWHGYFHSAYSSSLTFSPRVLFAYKVDCLLNIALPPNCLKICVGVVFKLVTWILHEPGRNYCWHCFYSGPQKSWPLLPCISYRRRGITFVTHCTNAIENSTNMANSLWLLWLIYYYWLLVERIIAALGLNSVVIFGFLRLGFTCKDFLIVWLSTVGALFYFIFIKKSWLTNNGD